MLRLSELKLLPSKLKWPQVVALSSVVLFFFWFLLILYAAPQFQETVGTDSLAMINVLFPYYWIILLAFVVICFSTFFKAESPGWLYMLLIGQLSLMLYFTPFLLSGFSWSPDSLWHGGVARYLPEILSGSKIHFSQYAQSYPFSFLITYFANRIIGIDIISFTLYIYPLIASVLISVLAYFFAARVLSNKVGFLALLFTLPAWHYIEPHVSPFSAGTILVLISLILLTYKSLLALVLTIFAVLLLTITHPISPISLGAYIFAYIIIGFLLKITQGKNLISKGMNRFSSIHDSVSFLWILTIAWLSWTVYHAMSSYPGLETAFLSIFNFGFLSRILNVSNFTVGGQGFIYPELHTLGLIIYGLFLLIMLFPFFEYLIHGLGNKTAKPNLMYDKMALSFAAVINAVMGFFLFLSSSERFLLGRGLLYFLLFGSMVFATYFLNSGQFISKLRKIFALGLIIFLFCSFPVISYSKEAYNSFTPSAEAGLIFLSSTVDLSKNSLSMGVDQQLAAYMDLSKDFISVPFPPNLTSESPDVIVLRINSYYVISMRYDLSFTNNSYTVLEENLAMNSDYNKIYSNSRFEIYVHSPLT
ncbi:hypothetical protein D4R86_04020 [bacterium]|nr:MAG: hypothetical protein D4R86_04020 [bacterium]